MYLVEIRTNHTWQVKSRSLKPRLWTNVSKKKFETQKQAEEEVAYLTLNFEDVGYLLKNFKVNYRIRKEGSTIWEKEETYNKR